MTHTIRGARIALATALLLAVVHASRADDAPDAVIERWDQSWTWTPDGSVVFEETRHVRLNHERAYGEFADPRITFVSGKDTLEVLTARTRLPDGGVLDVPPYSRNEVSPGATAGWPAYADVRQQVLTMSGITPGCVVEVSYRVTSRAGTMPSLALDLALSHRYPTKSRVISVTVPDTCKPRVSLSNAGRDFCSYSAGADASARTVVHRWTLHDVPPAADEPLAPPWRAWRPRLLFSTASDEEWLRERLARVEQASQVDPSVTELAAKWVAGGASGDRVRELQRRLAATFNFVEFDPAWRPPRIRPAATVLRENYGLPEEAAAALLALARAVGLTAEAALVAGPELVEAAGDERPRHGFAAADYAVGVWGEDGSGRVFWHPRYGRVEPDARWRGSAILLAHADGTDAVILEGALAPSTLSLRGKVTLGDDGRLSGRIGLAATGVFVTVEALRDSEGQRVRADELIRRLLPDAKVDKAVVTRISPERFEAELDVTTPQPLSRLDGAWRLAMGSELPSGLDVPMPLADGPRRLPVRLASRFTETIDLTVEWPGAWRAAAAPREYRASGAWGEVVQRVTSSSAACRVERTITAGGRDIPAADFVEFRAGVNACRAEAARTLLVRP